MHMVSFWQISGFTVAARISLGDSYEDMVTIQMAIGFNIEGDMYCLFWCHF